MQLVRLPEGVDDPSSVAAICDFGEIDGRFERLDLAEVEAGLAGGVVPELQELAGYGGEAVVGVSEAEAATRDVLADFVDERVFLDAVAGPLGLELELLAFFLGLAIGTK